MARALRLQRPQALLQIDRLHGLALQFHHAFREPPLHITGDADRYDHRAGNDDYTQAGNLFRLMSPAQKKLLIGALVGAMRSVPVEIQKRQIAHFAKADPAYGAGVAEGLGLKIAEVAAE